MLAFLLTPFANLAIYTISEYVYGSMCEDGHVG